MHLKNSNHPKSTPHQQAIKSGANPDVIGDRVVRMLKELDRDYWVNLEAVTHGCTATQTAILTAIARRIDQAGLFPECAIVYSVDEERDRSGITQEYLDTHPEVREAIRQAIENTGATP